MDLGSTQPLTEISTRNLSGVKCGRRLNLTISQPSVSRLCRKFGSLDISQPYRPPRPVTGIQQQEDQTNTKDNIPPIEEATERKPYGLRIF
jgi:hypothetical protein